MMQDDGIVDRASVFQLAWTRLRAAHTGLAQAKAELESAKENYRRTRKRLLEEIGVPYISQDLSDFEGDGIKVNKEAYLRD